MADIACDCGANCPHDDPPGTSKSRTWSDMAADLAAEADRLPEWMKVWRQEHPVDTSTVRDPSGERLASTGDAEARDDIGHPDRLASEQATRATLDAYEHFTGTAFNSRSAP